MKKLSLITLIIAMMIGIGFLAFSPFALANGPLAPPYQEAWMDKQVADSSLKNIQDAIYQSFVNGMVQKDPSLMEEKMDQLETLYAEKEQKLILYWMSYLQYYRSIYHLNAGEKKAAEKACEAAVDRLEKMKAKNSEDYALLAMIKSFGIQFQSPMKAPFTSNKVKAYAEKAISIDPKNLRAYYVLASNDFYTPEQYGGMKKAEEYLLKATSLPAQAAPNPYLPSWGKEESYEMLVKFYMKKENWEKAKETFQKGMEEFPESYTLQQLASKLVGK